MILIDILVDFLYNKIMDIKILIAAFTGIYVSIPQSCHAPVDYYDRVMEDGVCNKDEYTPECTDYLEKLIPFDFSWNCASPTEKNTVIRAYYSALFAPMGQIDRMLDGTYLPKEHIHALGLGTDNPNKIIFNRIMNIIDHVSYDGRTRDDTQLARYDFHGGMTINAYFLKHLKLDHWFLHLSTILHETQHSLPSVHILCPIGHPYEWCDLDRNGAYGFEAAALSSIFRGSAEKNDPGSSFYLTKDDREILWSVFEQKSNHIL